MSASISLHGQTHMCVWFRDRLACDADRRPRQCSDPANGAVCRESRGDETREGARPRRGESNRMDRRARTECNDGMCPGKQVDRPVPPGPAPAGGGRVVRAPDRTADGFAIGTVCGGVCGPERRSVSFGYKTEDARPPALYRRVYGYFPRPPRRSSSRPRTAPGMMNLSFPLCLVTPQLELPPRCRPSWQSGHRGRVERSNSPGRAAALSRTLLARHP